MSMRKRAAQESPRFLKHLAIHAPVEMGFMVFSNIAAKEGVDVIVASPKDRELRTIGIRIRTSSYKPKRKGWRFSDDRAYFIEKTPFFYIFCLKSGNMPKPIGQGKTAQPALHPPVFVVVSSEDLKKDNPSVARPSKSKNWGVDISRRQISEGGRWASCVNNFDQIREKLEDYGT